MSRLNQINRWNKPTKYKKQIKQFFWRFLKFYRTQCITLSYAIQSEEEARVDGTKNVF